MNLLPASVTVGQVMLGGSAIPAKPARALANGPVTLGVRPEHVVLDDAAPLRGSVAAAEYLGTTQLVTVDALAGRLIARIASAIPARIGDQVGLRFGAGQVWLFGAMTGRTLDG